MQFSLYSESILHETLHQGKRVTLFLVQERHTDWYAIPIIETYKISYRVRISKVSDPDWIGTTDVIYQYSEVTQAYAYYFSFVATLLKQDTVRVLTVE